MRTTLDLPDDLLERARAIARDTGQTLSRVVAQLVELGLDPGATNRPSVSPSTGLTLVSLGRIVTSADVRAFEDDA